MQKKHGFKPLGAADGLVKRAIFAGNATRIYGLKPKLAQLGITTDQSHSSPTATRRRNSYNGRGACATSSSRARFEWRTDVPSNCRRRVAASPLRWLPGMYREDLHVDGTKVRERFVRGPVT